MTRFLFLSDDGGSLEVGHYIRRCSVIWKSKGLFLATPAIGLLVPWS
jgi:hypothetical protein